MFALFDAALLGASNTNTAMYVNNTSHRKYPSVKQAIKHDSAFIIGSI
jgi:hypothetical protein